MNTDTIIIIILIGMVLAMIVLNVELLIKKSKEPEIIAIEKTDEGTYLAIKRIMNKKHVIYKILLAKELPTPTIEKIAAFLGLIEVSKNNEK